MIHGCAALKQQDQDGRNERKTEKYPSSDDRLVKRIP